MPCRELHQHAELLPAGRPVIEPPREPVGMALRTIPPGRDVDGVQLVPESLDGLAHPWRFPPGVPIGNHLAFMGVEDTISHNFLIINYCNGSGWKTRGKTEDFAPFLGVSKGMGDLGKHGHQSHDPRPPKWKSNKVDAKVRHSHDTAKQYWPHCPASRPWSMCAAPIRRDSRPPPCRRHLPWLPGHHTYRRPGAEKCRVRRIVPIPPWSKGLCPQVRHVACLSSPDMACGRFSCGPHAFHHRCGIPRQGPCVDCVRTQ